MMGLTAKNLCDSCINTGCEFQSGIMRIECDFYIPPRMEPIDKLYTKADIASIENRVRHAFNQGYDLGYKEGKERAKPQEQEPTTKNDLGVDREDAVERLNALKQFIGYDKDSEIVKATQKSLDLAIKALEQEPTTKNDLGVDCVARQDVERFIEGFINEYTPEEELEFINLELDGLKHLPPVTPQELKPMVEIDLYSVIKQKYIEREVLDKIKAEIEKARNTEIKEFNEETDIVEPTSYQRGSHEGYDEAITDVLQIIDKYKAESEKYDGRYRVGN